VSRRLLAAFVLAAALCCCAPPGAAAADLDLEQHIPLTWNPFGISVHNVYWSPSWDTQKGLVGQTQAAIDGTTQALLASDYFQNLSQYGVPAIQWGGSQAVDPSCGDTAPAVTNTPALMLLVKCEEERAVHGGIQSAIINLFLPLGTNIDDWGISSCVNYNAFHFVTLAQTGFPLPPAYPVYFAVIPLECYKLDGAAGVMSGISHELVEVATDPIPLLYWFDTSQVAAPSLGLPLDNPVDFVRGILGDADKLRQYLTDLSNTGEAGDICQTEGTGNRFQHVSFAPAGIDMRVASYWSNRQHACVVGNRQVVDATFTAPGAPAGVKVTVDGFGFPTAEQRLTLLEGRSYSFDPATASGPVNSGERSTSAGQCRGTIALADWQDADRATAHHTYTCTYTHEFHFITDPLVELGVNSEGHLNVCCGAPSEDGTRAVGLRFVPTGAESTAPGCLCEGWGAADAGAGVTGYANVASDGGARNMEVVRYDSTATTAVSVVDIPSRASPHLEVTHDYHPSPDSANLYEATVTIKNVSASTVTDLRYRRVMDWDIEPTEFDEFVTIDGANVTNLLYSSDNGFETANPLGPRTSIDAVGPPLGRFFTDSGPDDHGALFDFGFGALAPGASKAFHIYYGAAPNEAEALQSVAAVGAEVWSLGQPDCPNPSPWKTCPAGADGPGRGEPNTFVFAFSSVGGLPLAGEDRRPPVALSVFAPSRLALTGGAPQPNPFTIQGRAADISANAASGVTETISLEGGLTLARGPETAGIGDLAPRTSADATWDVAAPVKCNDATYSFTVTADYAGRPADEAARSVTRTVLVDGTCARVAGALTANGAPLAGAEVDLCPLDTVADCRVATTDGAGRYTLSGIALTGRYAATARPPASADPDLLPRTVEVAIAAGERRTVDVALSSVRTPRPGTAISGDGARPAGVDGLPVAYWQNAFTLTTTGCTGGSATFTLTAAGATLASGSLAESAPGTYGGEVGALYPAHGYARVSIAIDCPAQTPDDATSFDVYIDPSGVVQDSLSRPVAGATVTLLRRAASGAWVAEPAGSGVMSPANRRNPDTTDASGRFGWDVLAGSYKVRVEKNGCVPAESAVLDVPPPATGVEVDILCDTSPPTTQPVTDPAANANGWWRGDLTVNLSATDNPGGTGVASVTYSLAGAQSGGATVTGDTVAVPVTAEGVTAVTYAARDRAGNVEIERTTVVRIDHTPPQVAVSRTPVANEYGWASSSVTAQFVATDAGSGFAAGATETIDDVIAEEGARLSRQHTFTDLAGNPTDAVLADVNIDETAPQVTVTRTPPANASGWNDSAVTATFAATDGLSGLLGDASLTQVFADEGANQTGAHTFSDLAGNTAAGSIDGIDIDLTPPTLTCAATPSVLWPPDHALVPVTTDVRLTDALSGPAAFVLTGADSSEPGAAVDVVAWELGVADVDGGLRADRLGTGPGRTYALAYRGADKADNTSTCTATVTVPHDRR
jgi:hypothetical protein